MYYANGEHTKGPLHTKQCTEMGRFNVQRAGLLTEIAFHIMPIPLQCNDEISKQSFVHYGPITPLGGDYSLHSVKYKKA